MLGGEIPQSLMGRVPEKRGSHVVKEADKQDVR